jgi:hypothetical protein
MENVAQCVFDLPVVVRRENAKLSGEFVSIEASEALDIHSGGLRQPTGVT